jgi:hypothetical protein
MTWRLVAAHWPQLGLAFALLSIFGESLDEGDASSMVLCGLAGVCYLAWLLRTEDDDAPRDPKGSGGDGQDHRGGPARW